MLVLVVIFFFWFFLLLGIFSCFLGVYLFFFNSIVLNIFIPSLVARDITLSFCFDFIRRFFFSCVSIIRAIVFLYRKFYISVDNKFFTSDQMRFLCVLFLFVASIFFLVFSFSWFIVILGWDGLGVVSFLLVIYYNDSKSLDSGIITFLTNRLGDCFFLLSFIFIFYCGFYSFRYLGISNFILFLLFVIVGRITKRAQIPFSAWLPAAMAAPTPVSSLVHSSTLVTAGVFLLIRFNYLLISVYPFMIFISLITIILGGLFANYELDFKKIVAISTLRQLGFMVFSISVGRWLLGFIHIIFHAFFKSTLFLSTGSLIHFLIGDQDSRVFRGFFISFFCKLFFLIRCLCLIGFPFSLGFYSKDFILGGLLYLNNSSLICYIFVLSCSLTVSYRIRLLIIRFSKYIRFNPFINFRERKVFFCGVLVIFLLTVFIGDFFFFYFIPVNFLFSFFELFVGVLVFCGGIFVYLLLLNFYNLVFIFATIIFLPRVNFILSMKVIKKIFYRADNTWNEIFSAKGREGLVNIFSEKFKMLYFSSFVFFIIFVLLIFVNI